MGNCSRKEAEIQEEWQNESKENYENLKRKIEQVSPELKGKVLHLPGGKKWSSNSIRLKTIARRYFPKFSILRCEKDGAWKLPSGASICREPIPTLMVDRNGEIKWIDWESNKLPVYSLSALGFISVFVQS